MLQACGLSCAQLSYVRILWRWTVLQWAVAALFSTPRVVSDLAPLRAPTGAEAIFLSFAARIVAREAAQLLDNGLAFSAGHSAHLVAFCAKLQVLSSGAAAVTPAMAAASPVELCGSTRFNFFGRLRRPDPSAIEALAGESETLPIILPVQLSLVGDRVNNFNDVSNALRHASQLCELLANQMEHLPNTYHIRLCLIQQLVTSVIPLPLPCSQTPHRCFWSRESIRYETQADLLRLLNLLGRHFATSCFSVRATRAVDAVRLVVVACIATLADVVMRLRAVDVPSLFCLNYSGEAEGPGTPFGFEMGSFAIESEGLQLSSPELQIARSRVLDYFAAQRASISEACTLFRFERSMAFGNAEFRLLQQLCLHLAFPSEPAADLLPAYLSGESRLLLENFPEIGFFRDIVFLFKMLMVPSSDALPDLCAWMPLDAVLSWRYRSDEGFIVCGFGRQLNAASMARQAEGGDNSWMSRGLRMLGLSEKPRAPPSAADPSALLQSELGTELHIEREEDVLHLKQLPSFDGTLNAADAELLIQYLTVPYLRVPLLLRFFAQPSHVHALGHPKLQAALDAALYEPGLWQRAPFKRLPELVPAREREHLATPSGILFNELVRSPAGVTGPLLRLIELALELDSGRYSASSLNCAAILYVIRITVRIEGFVRAVLNENCAAVEARGAGITPPMSPRGITCNEVVCAELETCAARLRRALMGELHAMLEQWCVPVLRARDVHSACIIFAHLGFSYKFVDESELDSQAVSTLICSQVFLGNNHSFDVHAAALGTRIPTTRRTHQGLDGEGGGGASDAVLGVLYVELFELFSRHRCKLLRWLEAKPRTQCNTIMEAVVRSVTFNGPRQTPLAAARLAQLPRNWRQRSGFRGLGRYVPDTAAATAATGDHDSIDCAGDVEYNKRRVPLDTAEIATLSSAGGTNHIDLGRGHSMGATEVMPAPAAHVGVMKAELESWLQQMTTANEAEAEVDVQLGLFSLQKRTLSPLPAAVYETPDFDAACGSALDPIQAVELVSTRQRRWFRLVGQRVDVQLWAPWTSCAPALIPCRAHGAEGPNMEGGPPSLRNFPSELRNDECWVQEVLLVAAPSVMHGWSLRLVEHDVSNTQVALLQATHATPTGLAANKELMILRAPPVVFIFELIEYGRRLFRSLIFASDAALSLHQLMPRRRAALTQRGANGQVLYHAGDASHVTPPLPSVVISRMLTARRGLQTFMPPRLLCGLVPEVLLQQYDIWQNANDSLTGYSKDELGPALAHTELRIRLYDHLTDSGATIERLSLVAFDDSAAASDGGGGGGTLQQCAQFRAHHQAVAVVDSGKPVLTLLNLLSAPADSALFCLTQHLLMLEDLAYILMWSKSPSLGSVATGLAAGALCADLIELPRLKLSFEPRHQPHHTTASAAPPLLLHCLQYEGYYISCSESAAAGFPKGVPNTLLLERKDGHKAVLVSACAMPRQSAVGAADAVTETGVPTTCMVERLFPAEIELDRANQTWLANIGPTRHYLYPVHVTEGRLHCPTLAAALYMLLLRFLARQYDAVVALANRCTSETELSTEEAQICTSLSDLDDQNPEAHACRLWLSLYALHTPLAAFFRWDLASELAAYVRKVAHVSLLLRLHPADELVLLEFVRVQLTPSGATAAFDPGDDVLRARHAVLTAAAAASDAVPTPSAQQQGLPKDTFNVALPPIRRPGQTLQFDAVHDASCIEDERICTAILQKLTRLSYSRPESMVGLCAVKALDSWLSHGLELRGGRDEKGFLFLYELMRGDLIVKILNNDSSHTLGTLLLRVLPASDTQSKNVLMSTLRVMASNPHVSRHLPKCAGNLLIFPWSPPSLSTVSSFFQFLCRMRS